MTRLGIWTVDRWAKPPYGGRREGTETSDPAVRPVRVGSQDVVDGCLAFRQRQGQTVADIAANKLDVRLCRGALKESGLHRAQAQLFGGRHPVVAVDDHLVRPGNDDRGPVAFQLSQAEDVGPVEAAFPKMGPDSKVLHPDNHDVGPIPRHRSLPALYLVYSVN
jgi:hypothetical protein